MSDAQRAGASPHVRPEPWRDRLRDDSGQIMLLSIAYAALALALVLVIASASAVHIERKRLVALADAAALDAADAIDLSSFYGDRAVVIPPDGGVAVPLTDRGVRLAVQAHLEGSPASSSLHRLAVGEPTGAVGGTTAQVTLVARARPPFVPWALVGWSDGIPLMATSTARAG